MKKCAACGGANVVTLGALPAMLFGALTVLGVAAFRASIALFPLFVGKVGHASVVIWKPSLKLKDREALKLLLHSSNF